MSDESSSNSTSGFLSGRGPLIALAALVVISMGAVCALGYTLLNSDGVNLGGSGGDSGADNIEPTPFSQAVSELPAGGEAIVYGISDTSTISVTLDAPLSLRLDEREFVVLPQTINPDGKWSPGLSGDTAVGWVHGTIINYIMALQSTGSNRELMQSLTPGMELVMTTQSGSDLVFEVEGSRQVAANDQSVFAQLSPGLTLMLMGSESDERFVVDGRYVITEPAGGGGASENNPEIGIGEAVQLDGLQVMINNVTYMPDHPDTPPGFAFFILDGQFQNVGSTTVDAGTMRLVLSDEIGNQYALNPVASRLGDHAPLTGGFIAQTRRCRFRLVTRFL